jgi:hypothetical protein
MPHSAWAEVLYDMTDRDAVPVPALVLHFPDAVGRSELERWMRLRRWRDRVRMLHKSKFSISLGRGRGTNHPAAPGYQRDPCPT